MTAALLTTTSTAPRQLTASCHSRAAAAGSAKSAATSRLRSAGIEAVARSAPAASES
jgi:hypothetical protein